MYILPWFLSKTSKLEVKTSNYMYTKQFYHFVGKLVNLITMHKSLLRSSSDDRILWIRSGIEIMWLIEHIANGGQLLT